MFQCHSPKSSHPLPLPQSPKDCSIHLCLLFIKRTEAEAEAPIFWLLDAKNWLIGKDRDAGKDWRQEKGMTGWEGWMASLTRRTWVWASSGSWWWTGKPGVLHSIHGGRKESDTTEHQNHNTIQLSSDTASGNNTPDSIGEELSPTGFPPHFLC